MGVEGVHHPAVRVQADANLQTCQSQWVVLRVGVLLRVAVLPQEVVVEAFALLRNVGVQEHGMVPDNCPLIEAHAAQREVQRGLADVREGAAHVRQDVDHDLRAPRGPGDRWWQGKQLRELLETNGVGKLQAGLGGRHELPESGEALLHGDVQVTLVHHRVPALVHGLRVASLHGVAHGVPRHVPEVAVVEARDARRPRAADCVAAGAHVAPGVDLREGAHLHDHDVVLGLELGYVAVLVHHDQAGSLRLLSDGGVALVGVHLLVQDRDEVRVDVPRQPVVAELLLLHLVCGPLEVPAPRLRQRREGRAQLRRREAGGGVARRLDGRGVRAHRGEAIASVAGRLGEGGVHARNVAGMVG
mmetsp:Transcript_89077/g.276827  ORF Transcript_89077/g.276827 Transcript_89077/m.276827 type:complete len:359 (-) Transcript_89077:106-1182(-)